MKRSLVLSFLGVLLCLFLSQSVEAQIKKYEFRDVSIPLTLIHEDITIKKGEYNLEIIMPEIQSARNFYLRISKKRDSLCMVSGKKLHYDVENISVLSKDPNIPKDPRLVMRKNKRDKILSIIFESGKNAAYMPYEKIKFEFKYEE